MPQKKVIAIPTQKSWPTSENVTAALHNLEFIEFNHQVKLVDKEAEEAVQKGTPYIEPFLPGFLTFMDYREEDIPSMKAYIKNIAKAHIIRAQRIGNGLEKAQLNIYFDTFKDSFIACTEDPVEEKITLCKDHLNALVSLCNQVLDAHPNSYRYPNDGEDAFSTYQVGLKTFTNFTPEKHLEPRNPSAPKVPLFKLDTIAATLPKALADLIHDLITSRSNSAFIDERHVAQVEAKSATPKMPGSLRCFHADTAGALPDISTLETPNHAKRFETHVCETAKLSNKMGDKTSTTAPTGYAEYTGTGIQSDAHYSKIVFDYKRGVVFLTLTHYKPWVIDGDGEAKIVSGFDEPGVQSGFFGVVD